MKLKVESGKKLDPPLLPELHGRSNPMKYDPDIHHRRSIRLKGYDYSSPGAYFVTTVTRKRECLFGEVVEGSVHLSKMGGIVQQVWLDLSNHYSLVVLDAFCIMPNHVHCIIILTDTLGRGGSELQLPSVPDQIQEKSNIESNEILTRSYVQYPSMLDQIRVKSKTESDKNLTRPYARYGLPEIVRAVKSFSARRINRLRRISGVPVWQRNYYERIIRNENELNAIRRYILYNPLQWKLDGENPATTQI